MFTTLEKVGLICITVVGIQLTRTIFKILYNTVIGSAMGKGVKLKDMGKWAVVTGATDGIGRAYAEALAQLGIDIILISRSLDKLRAVADEIEAQFKVRTTVIQADFTDITPETYDHIEKTICNAEVGILVNNVGMSYPYPEYFLNLPDSNKVDLDIIKCNIMSITNMTRMLLPQMVERHKGVIINISSTAAAIPSPMLTVYGASKAYVEKFSRDLAAEYNKKGVIVQCLMPGYVATKMSKIKKSTWMAPSPADFVARALPSIGIQDVTTGYFPHTLLVAAVQLLNSISASGTVWLISNTMENIRRRALRRRTDTVPN